MPQGAAVRIADKSYISVKNFLIRGASYGVTMAGSSASSNLIENNHIMNGLGRIYIGSGAHDNMVRNNKMESNQLGFETRPPGPHTEVAGCDPANYAAGVNYHTYQTFKYTVGDSVESRGNSGIRIISAGTNNEIVGNEIFYATTGIDVSGTTGTKVHENTIRNMAAQGFFIQSNVQNLEIYDNLLHDSNINIRLSGMEDGNRLVYIYRNRMYNIPKIGEHFYFHFTPGSPPPSSPSEFYIYHNSAAGGGNAFGMSTNPVTAGGMPKVRFINNVFSSYSLYTPWVDSPFITTASMVGVFDYNWAGGLYARGVPAWFGSNNINARDQKMWNDATMPDFKLPTGSLAIDKGIDLSKSWTVNGVTYPVMPGMASGYFSGIAPDMGAVEFTGTTPPVFDFSLTNGGNKSVNQGSSVTNSVTATLVSGTSQSISFSTSGLPTGAMATFSPTSCSPTCPTTLTISTLSTTPAGNYTITVTGTAIGGLTKQTTFALTVIGVDRTAPIISSVSANSLTSSSATITWTTDEPADSQVEYGLTTSYGQSSALQSTLVTSHSAAISGLSAGSLYHYRVKSRDASDNLATSLDNTFTTLPAPDTQPPSAIASLAASGVQTNSFTLSWQAPSDPPSNGAAASYDIRYSTSPLSESNWSSALQATGEPSPAAPGTTQTYILAGLNPATTYYVGIKSQDSASPANISLLSNVVVVTTPPPEDTIAPEISSVSASSITSSSATITWTTNESADSQVEYGLTTSYGQSTTLNSTLLTSHSQSLTSLLANTTYHYKVKSKDAALNPAVSGDFTFTTTSPPDTESPAQIINLSAANITSNSATLNWTAPGDDGNVGTASSYEIRYATFPITSSNFFSATSITSPPLPQIAGTAESITIGSLLSQTTYYAAIKTTDDVGNVSSISNIAAFTTAAPPPVPDTTPPIISNIQVTSITQNSATTTWSTNELADSLVMYDTSQTNLSKSVSSSNLSTSHSLDLTGLVRKTKYYYQVLSKDAANNQASSTVFNFTTSAGKPSKVQNLNAKRGSVILTWDVPQDPFLNQIAVFRRQDRYPLQSDVSNIVSTLPFSSVSYTDTNAQDGTTYYYSVFTVDTDNIYSDSAQVSFTPTAPSSAPAPAPGNGGGGGGGGGAPPVPAPSDLKVFGGENQIILTWKNPVDSNFVRTRVIRKANSAPISPNDGEIIYEGDKEEFTDTTAKPGVKYHYAIFSLDRNLSSSSLARASASRGEMSNQDIEKSLAKATSTPAISIPKFKFKFARFLQFGSRHDEVKNLQTLLNFLGLTVASQGPGSIGQETDFFGALTASAVKKFQAKYGIEQVGFIGPKTRAKLNELSEGESIPAPSQPVIGIIVGPFAFGYQNSQVTLLQQMLAKDHSIYPEALVTGYYGSLTRKAVERFQSKYGIEQTGIAGPLTRVKLNEVYVR